jgi:hypothetical protein
MIYIYKTFSGLIIYIYKKVVSNTPQIDEVYSVINLMKGCHGCDRIVAGFITTYAISAYHHKSRSGG